MNLDHLSTQEQLEVLNRLIGSADCMARHGKGSERAKANHILAELQTCVDMTVQAREKRKQNVKGMAPGSAVPDSESANSADR